MADTLRELLAVFDVKVDPEGALAKGNKAVDGLRDKFDRADEAAKRFGKNKIPKWVQNARIPGEFGPGRAEWLANVQRGPTRRDMWAGRAFERQDAAASPQFGPTRETLYAHQRAQFVAMSNAREATLKANEAAAAYAKTLRGRLSGALGAVRDSLNGGGSGGGAGLTKGLFTLQNGFRALIGGAVANGLLNVVQRVSRISDEAQRLGLTNREFQELDLLAKKNTISLDGLGDAMQGLSKAATAVGKSQAQDALLELGVVTKNTDGTFRSRNDLFFDTAIKLAEISDETKRAALLGRIYGEGARRIQPIIAKGADALRAQREELSKVNFLTDEQIASAKGFTDAWETAKIEMLALAGPVLKDLLIPMMLGLVKAFTGAAKAIAAFVRPLSFATNGLAGFALIAARFLGTLNALVTLGGGWGRVIAGWGRALAGLALRLAPVVAAFLVLEDILVFFAGGDSLIGRALDKAFGKGTGKGVQKTIQDLTDAFKDLWKWILGDGAGEKFRSLMSEIGQGLRLLVNDALALIPGSGRVSGLQGLQDYESGKLTAPPGTRGAASNRNFDPAVFGMKSGDTNITIVNPPPGEGVKMAGQVKGALERDRAATLATVQ